MMKNYIFTLLLLIVSGNIGTYGQNSPGLTVKGTVKDQFSNETLVGVAIVIEGTQKGTITDIDGNYTIEVPSGESVLLFSYLGYVKERVFVNDRTIIDIEMAPDISTLGEVQVYAQLLGQREALSRQVNALGIVNVVSADRMSELPDVNAAEAIGRLPGVSINRVGGEGTSVVLRGLAPKLTSVTINNVRVPSSSTNDRSVDLSMISPELLSDIEVFKSPTADMDGDAIGGIVNLGVAKAPVEPRQQFRVWGGYNALRSDFANYKGSLSLSQRIFDNKVGVIVRANYENINRSSESMSVGWGRRSDNDSILLTQSSSISDDNRITSRVGGDIQFDYEYASGEVVFQSFYSQRKADATSLSQNLNINGGEVRHTPSTTVGRNYTMQNILSGKQNVYDLKIDWTLAQSTTRANRVTDIELDFRQPNAFDSEIRGQFLDDPDLIYQSRRFDYSSTYLYRYNSNPHESNHNNLTASLDLQHDYNLASWWSGFIKTGGKIRVDDRIFRQDYKQVFWYYLLPDYVFRAADNWPDELILGGPDSDKIMIENFYTSDENINIWNSDTYFIHPGVDRSLMNRWHKYQQSELLPQYSRIYLDYDAYETVYAGYVMGTIEIGNWLKMVPGVRYEYSDNNYKGKFSTLGGNGDTGFISDSTAAQNYGELLPNMHIKITPVKWLDVRFSAVKTLSRPDYNMLTPNTYVDVTNGNVSLSNPDLRHAKAWNYDAGITIYSSQYGLLSIGGFYKHFDDYFTNITRSMSPAEAAERGMPIDAYDVDQDFVNFDDSEVRGIEIDLQTNLSFLEGIWKGVVINANVSRMWSKTFFPLFVPERFYNPVTRRYEVDYEASYFDKIEGPLPSQVDLIGNLSLGYDLKGFSARVSMVYQGASLRSFRVDGTEEGLEFTHNYTDEYLRFDGSISQEIGNNLKIYASLANISGESERRYRYRPQYVTSTNEYGAIYELGIQYRF
jgi:TonB-dependent receptor